MVRLAASLLLLAAGLAHAQSAERPKLSERIGDLLGRPAAQRTHWGVCVVDLDTGETLYQHGEDRLFVPASNVKLFSTAIALRRLGRDYAFATSVVGEGSISESGRLDGDLRLIGGGDPNLSSRELPYRKREDFARDRLGPLRRLAQAVKNAGIDSIAGNVVGDDSRYVWQPYPRGWSYADTLLGYGSPTSALVFNDNLIALRVTPGAAGGPARAAIVPTLPYYSISNRPLPAS
ncbi:MAG: D-alanyl-D-alanine carboxypeptidase/D-alanyl-D-alanine-endopeptidase, partial [Acidobacteriia bacterium]|nr:D-alanyl-D-alanine carboxypeptidase/D-alanyl-D-alanine-endopeptidase [Terriglobia bacterium]